jgi:hypothetical protein
VETGYQNGRFIKHCSQPNTRLVVSATQVHARVIGLAAKAHSYNYLSAVVHGYADEPIDKRDLVTKRILSEKIVNHLGMSSCRRVMLFSLARGNSLTAICTVSSRKMGGGAEAKR